MRRSGAAVALVVLPAVIVPLICAGAGPATSAKSPASTIGAPTAFDFARTDGPEDITVLGRRPRLTDAPVGRYGRDRAPWEADRAIHDTMTGSNTSAFGNAYNLGSPLGSDERGNETGGSFVAPRHD